MNRMPRLALLAGVARYEFRMQVRRRSVWLVLLGLGLPTLLAAGLQAPLRHTERGSAAHLSLLQGVVGWASAIEFVLPVGLGILLADRWVRDERTGVTDLFDGLPAPAGIRLFGKYLGATLATYLPILVVYALGVAFIALAWRDLAAFPLALLALAVLHVPGILFVAAFSIVCPLIMPVPVYQVLYTGYWFWGNFLSPQAGIPSLSYTPLTPGPFVRGYDLLGDDTAARILVTPDPLRGVFSFVLLLALAALALLVAWRYVRWLEARK